MARENIYTPFEIIYKELDECPKKEHRHNFFELVYIAGGTGRQCINQNKFDYREGHLFLITPEDCHSFEVTTTTRFFFIRFNDIYIRKNILQADSIRKLEFILQNANHQPGCLLRNKADKPLVKALVEAMLRESVNKDFYNKELIQQLVNTLIVVVARNIARYLPEEINDNTTGKVMEILQYIQQHIYYPEKIRTDNISRQFGVSETYLGRYFKKHTKETLQQYISHYKLKLVENRLLHSDLRINEIVRELGFTDESHLNRSFKKFSGMSPTAFRRKQVANEN